jgi:hypothetical protein
VGIPGEFSYLGKTRFEVRGAYPAATIVGVGGVVVPDLAVNAAGVTGTVPAYSGAARLPVRVDLALDWGADGETLPGAVTYVGPLQAASAASAPACVGGQVTVRGLGFTPETRVRINGAEMPADAVEFASARELRVQAPALPENAYDIEAVDTHGATGAQVRHLLRAGLGYTSAVAVTAVTPNVASEAGGTLLRISGRGFAAANVFRVNGVPLRSQQITSSSAASGDTPPLRPGTYDLEVTTPSGCTLAALRGAVTVEALPRPIVDAIEPPTLSEYEPLTIRGRNFHARTEVFVGEKKLLLPLIGTDGASIFGFAPSQGFEGLARVRLVDPRFEEPIEAGELDYGPRSTP